VPAPSLEDVIVEEDVLVVAEPAKAKVGTAAIARARNRWFMGTSFG
jgi:hypothetical protein